MDVPERYSVLLQVADIGVNKPAGSASPVQPTKRQRRATAKAQQQLSAPEVAGPAAGAAPAEPEEAAAPAPAKRQRKPRAAAQATEPAPVTKRRAAKPLRAPGVASREQGASWTRETLASAAAHLKRCDPGAATSVSAVKLLGHAPLRASPFPLPAAPLKRTQHYCVRQLRAALCSPGAADHAPPEHVHGWAPEAVACAALGSLLDSVELPDRLLPKAEQGNFAPLVRSILYQQLAGAAADAIHKRFVAACQVRRPARRPWKPCPAACCRCLRCSWGRARRLTAGRRLGGCQCTGPWCDAASMSLRVQVQCCAAGQVLAAHHWRCVQGGEPVTPEAVLAVPVATLRACGLSERKACQPPRGSQTQLSSPMWLGMWPARDAVACRARPAETATHSPPPFSAGSACAGVLRARPGRALPGWPPVGRGHAR